MAKINLPHTTHDRTPAQGFTIVELLIVIVVIAILAAIIIVAYNGMNTRAKDSAAQVDLHNNYEKLLYTITFGAGTPSPSDSATLSSVGFQYTSGVNGLVAYCAAGDNFALVAQAVTGDQYYITQGGHLTGPVTNLTMSNPCTSLGIASATSTYIGMNSTSCASESGTCTLSKPGTIAFGANGTFNVKTNMSGSVGCNTAVFGDPTPGVVKACYLFQY